MAVLAFLGKDNVWGTSVRGLLPDLKQREIFLPTVFIMFYCMITCFGDGLPPFLLFLSTCYIYMEKY